MQRLPTHTTRDIDAWERRVSALLIADDVLHFYRPVERGALDRIVDDWLGHEPLAFATGLYAGWTPA